MISANVENRRDASSRAIQRDASTRRIQTRNNIHHSFLVTDPGKTPRPGSRAVGFPKRISSRSVLDRERTPIRTPRTVDTERRRRASPLGVPRAMRVKELFRSSHTPRVTSHTVASFVSRPDDDPTRDRDPGVSRSRYERIGRSIRRDTRSRIVAGRQKHATTKTNHVASHAPLDRLGRLEGGNLAEHGGRGDGRHGDRLVTFLERTNGDRRARGGEVDSLRAWIYYSNLDGVFIFIWIYYVL